MSNIAETTRLASSHGSISCATQAVLDSFHRLKELSGPEASLRTLIVDKEARFRLWAGNLGAHRDENDSKSAAYRLRHVPEVTQSIHTSLSELLETTQDLYAILSGAREEQTAEPDEADPSEAGPVSELSELWLMVDDTITNLMKVSILLRQTSEKDRHVRVSQAAAKYKRFDSSYDIDYVRNRYPKLEQQTPWLLQRLGKAITARRQFLAYSRDHHLRIANEVPSDPAGPPPERHERVNEQERHERVDEEEVITTFTRPTLASTKATTIAPGAISAMQLHQLDHLETDDMVSVASSFVSSQGHRVDDARLRVIDLASLAPADGGPFQCRYCQGLVMFRTQRNWHKHVLQDLRPYICTFPGCEVEAVSTFTAWFAHESMTHRRQWCCPLCEDGHCKSEDDVIAHINSVHGSAQPSIMTPLLYESIAASSPVVEYTEPSSCPFCDTWDTSLRQERETREGTATQDHLSVSLESYARHLKLHMDQLALFAIPPGSFDDEDGEADNSIRTNANQAGGDRSSDQQGSRSNEEPSDPSSQDSRSSVAATWTIEEPAVAGHARSEAADFTTEASNEDSDAMPQILDATEEAETRGIAARPAGSEVKISNADSYGKLGSEGHAAEDGAQESDSAFVADRSPQSTAQSRGLWPIDENSEDLYDTPTLEDPDDVNTKRQSVNHSSTWTNKNQTQGLPPQLIKLKVHVPSAIQLLTLFVPENTSFQTLRDRIDAKLARGTEFTLHAGASNGRNLLKLKYLDDDDYVSIGTNEEVAEVLKSWRQQRGADAMGVRMPEVELFCH